MKSIALFGGTFNPVHFGHLRMALELRQALNFDEMRLLPAHLPAHRDKPGATASQRRDMLLQALQECRELTLDERELRRKGITYTVDTLEALRVELGTKVSISFCMGLDSLLNLPRWYRWERLLELAHLVVVTRPGWQLPQAGEVAALLSEKTAAAKRVHETAAGCLILREQTLLPISASCIRQMIKAGHSPQFLLPDAVLQYIQRCRLYLT